MHVCTPTISEHQHGALVSGPTSTALAIWQHASFHNTYIEYNNTLSHSFLPHITALLLLTHWLLQNGVERLPSQTTHSLETLQFQLSCFYNKMLKLQLVICTPTSGHTFVKRQEMQLYQPQHGHL
jgi:hypothetical protein